MKIDPSGLTVRRARRSDHQAILEMAPRLVEFDLPPGRDRHTVLEGMLGRLTEALARDAEVYLTEDGQGTLLGFVHLQERDDLDGVPRTHVHDLVVGESGHGVGRFLMNFALTWARQRGHQRLGLTVLATNERAIGFYQDLGMTCDTLGFVTRV